MKRIKFALVVLVTALFVTNPVVSQVNFQKGFIVDTSMDTIKGFIDYRKWDVTPTAIQFKVQPESTIINYTPNDIHSFGVAGEIYTSGIVTIEESLYDEKKVENFEKYLYRTDTVYLQVLISGEKSLYYTKDKDMKTYFYIGQEGNYQWLIFRKYTDKIYGNIFEKMDEKYKGQLNLYFIDCPTLKNMISSTSYNRTALLSLFNEYYTCKKSKIDYQFKVEKFKPEFGLIGGMSFTQIKFAGDPQFNFLILADYPVSKNITFGLFCNIPFPRKLNKLSFYNDLLYTSYHASYAYGSSSNKEIYTIKTSSIGNNSLRLNSMLRYKFPIKDMFLFINGGISNGRAISKTNSLMIEDHVYSVYNKSEKVALINSRSWERGYIVGIGGIFKKIECEFRMVKTDGMSDYRLLASPVWSNYFLLEYRF